MTRSFYPWQKESIASSTPFLTQEEVFAEMGIDICGTIEEQQQTLYPRLMDQVGA
jgi:hypothetical protein